MPPSRGIGGRHDTHPVRLPRQHLPQPDGRNGAAPSRGRDAQEEQREETGGTRPRMPGKGRSKTSASRLLERRVPGGELRELLVGAVVVADALVERGDGGHVGVREREVEDGEVVVDVVHVAAAGNHGEAHLHVPAQHDLGGGAPGAGGDVREDGLPQQRLVAVAERIPAHEADAEGVERPAQLALREVGVRLDLHELRDGLPLRRELLQIAALEVRDADRAPLAVAEGLLAITVPLCWFGKELVAGRQTIRAKIKREFVAQMLHSPAPVLW